MQSLEKKNKDLESIILRKENGEPYTHDDIEELERMKAEKIHMAFEVESMAIYQQRAEELESDLKSYVIFFSKNGLEGEIGKIEEN